MSTDDVAAFVREQCWRKKLSAAETFSSPLPIGPGVKEQGDYRRCVADDPNRHRRLVSFSARMLGRIQARTGGVDASSRA